MNPDDLDELERNPEAPCAEEFSRQLIQAAKRAVVQEPTLRDRFAMAALTYVRRDFDCYSTVAEQCYMIADAMLAARGPAHEEAKP